MSGKIYFTADLHLGHKNVIAYDDRPFNSVEEMDETIIRNWNRKVDEDDDVYIVGDVTLCGRELASKLLHRLNGRLHLIFGNHDKPMKKEENKGRFTEITDEKIILLNGKRILLRHEPREYWKDMTDIDFFIYAHIHNNVTAFTRFARCEPKYLNAGIMLTGYSPVTFEELRKYNYLSWARPHIKISDDKLLMAGTSADKLYFNNRNELFQTQDFFYYFSLLIRERNYSMISDIVTSSHKGYRDIIEANLQILFSLFTSKPSEEVKAMGDIMWDYFLSINYAINDMQEERDHGYWLRDDNVFKESKRPYGLVIPEDQDSSFSIDISKEQLKAFISSIASFRRLMEAKEENVLTAAEYLLGPCSDKEKAKKLIHVINKYADKDPTYKDNGFYLAMAIEVEGRL